jgi:alpha-methylacyl-CoA racemase
LSRNQLDPAVGAALTTDAPAASAGPLTGIRLLELAGIGPGPYACMLLADMGAEVIRIDRPSAGAASETLDPMLRSRRTIALNLKQQSAVDVVLKLVERSDVLVEGFRPKVAERLGIGPEVCCKLNPRLIYGRITGWGQSGPLAHTAGHDINYLALSGLLHQIGSRDSKPEPPLNVVGDFGGGGMLLAFGIVCALQERSRSGRGQVVDTAIIDGAASFLSGAIGLQAQGAWRDGAPGQNFLSGAAHFYGTYETRDGRWVAVGAIEPKFHEILIKKLGLDCSDFEEGVGFSHAPYDSLLDDVWPRLRQRLAAAIRRFDRDELEAMFDGSDACVTPVLTIDEAKRHPHNLDRGTFVDLAGLQQNAPAPRFSRTVPAAPRPPVKAGSDCRAILRELDFSDEEIAKLRADGAIP